MSRARRYLTVFSPNPGGSAPIPADPHHKEAAVWLLHLMNLQALLVEELQHCWYGAPSSREACANVQRFLPSTGLACSVAGRTPTCRQLSVHSGSVPSSSSSSPKRVCAAHHNPLMSLQSFRNIVGSMLDVSNFAVARNCCEHCWEGAMPGRLLAHANPIHQQTTCFGPPSPVSPSLT